MIKKHSFDASKYFKKSFTLHKIFFNEITKSQWKWRNLPIKSVFFALFCESSKEKLFLEKSTHLWVKWPHFVIILHNFSKYKLTKKIVSADNTNQKNSYWWWSIFQRNLYTTWIWYLLQLFLSTFYCLFKMHFMNLEVTAF